jgi:hypothetical protein
MNNTPSSSNLEDRMLALEARITELEQQCEAAQLNIPWHVICAAIAAVMPNVRIVHVAPVSSVRNQWRASALMRNINSHQIR